jgi:D-alanyl-D-alanine-carboxypeptidase/D-alanyl-D-alanine-endopeptidase
MKKNSSLIVFALFTVISFAQTIKRIDGTKIPVDSIQKKIDYLMKTANVSGVAVSIFNNDKPVFSKTFGLANVPKNEPLTPNSVMYGASFSKAVFAYIVMQYVDEKVIDLDKPLVAYLSKPLPEYEFNSWKRGYKDLQNDERYKKITARMCLSHTTGFPNWRWIEPDKKLKIKLQPGTHYSYSGEGLYLLQFVLEQIAKKNFEDIAQEKVFKPLDMQATSYIWQKRFDTAICLGHNAGGEPYELNQTQNPNSAGSLSTTLSDYNKFFTALIIGQGISKKAFVEMTKPQVRIKSRSQFGPFAQVDGTENDNIELSYGLGFGVFKTPYGKAFFKEGHDDGWGHYSISFPDKKIAIIIMTNNDNGESIFKELLAFAIGDTFTPWQWENYIPYDAKN